MQVSLVLNTNSVWGYKPGGCQAVIMYSSVADESYM